MDEPLYSHLNMSRYDLILKLSFHLFIIDPVTMMIGKDT